VNCSVWRLEGSSCRTRVLRGQPCYHTTTATAIFPAYGNCSHVSPEQHDTLTPILSNSSSQFASRDIHDTLFSEGQRSHTSFRQHLSGAAHCLGLEKHCMIHLVICSLKSRFHFLSHEDVVLQIEPSSIWLRRHHQRHRCKFALLLESKSPITLKVRLWASSGSSNQSSRDLWIVIASSDRKPLLRARMAGER